MRATISFEVEVSRVKDIMRSLVLEESGSLFAATRAIEGVTSATLSSSVDEALRHLKNATDQLEQYRRMVVEFERARFESAQAPTGATAPLAHTLAEARDALDAMKRFDTFVDKVQEDVPEEKSDAKPKEG